MSILYEKKENQIAYITINRPQVMNAIDPEANRQLEKAWLDFRDDPDVLVAILTGAGDQAFCSGADIKRMVPGMGPESRLYGTERRVGFIRGPGCGGITREIEIYKPIIAAVNGYALAEGLEIALACDIILASENAFFGLPQVGLGVIPGAGATQRLPRMIPFKKAMEMILTGERIDAQEAYRLGLINKVVPLDRLLPEAEAMALKICEKGPIAIQAAKEVVLRGMRLSLQEGLLLEASMLDDLLETEDAREGARAFVEHRKVHFRGK